jgi:Cof subfamily protein (haloacid dehalogenase superfamily)
MIKLVASDLDGTIIDKDNSIIQTNFDAIKAINDKKINFVICTGKTYPIIKGVCSKFDANFGIFGNGNQIINLKTGEEIYKQLLTKEEIDTCINIAKKNNLHVHLYTDNEIITEDLLYMDLRNFKLKDSNFYNSSLKFNIVKDVKDYIDSNDIDICKLVISSPVGLDDVKKELVGATDLTVTTINKRGKYKDNIIDKEYEYLDITPKNISKSHALAILGDYLNVNQSEMMAIGDNLNDLEMVKDSGIGVAVANAYDELKEVATYITEKPVEKGGFAEAVYKYIEF